jgi:protein ERP2
MISFKFLLALTILLQLYKCEYHSELSIVIEPGQRDCLHQYLLPNLNIDTDYQVISGGELDISFWVTSPSNKVILTEIKKQGGQYHFRTEEAGEYRFCFDNSFSHFANKQVFFYLATNDQFVDPMFPREMTNFDVDKFARDKMGEMDDKVDVFRETFNRMSAKYEHLQRLQNQYRNYELIDRSYMEHNFERVNFWSIVNILVMVTVGFVQVFMIRSLFEEKSKIGKVLRGSGGGSASDLRSGVTRSFT